MHPIEHLRYLARADSVDAAALVAETATALGSLRGDHATLVVAARRIIERHPTVGALWWLCAHMLVSDEPRVRAWELADELSDDATAVTVAAELPIGGSVVVGAFDPMVAEACADRPDVGVTCSVVAEPGRWAARRIARFGVAIDTVDAAGLCAAAAASDVVLVALAAGTPDLVLVAPEAAAAARAAAAVGTPVWLVAPVGTCLPRRYVEAIAEAAPERVTALDPAVVARVLGPAGAGTDAGAALAPAAPMAPELLRAVGAR